MVDGTGTKADPWQLQTPPGTSGYTMWIDDAADPPAIICQVGGTQHKYDKQDALTFAAAAFGILRAAVSEQVPEGSKYYG